MKTRLTAAKSLRSTKDPAGFSKHLAATKVVLDSMPGAVASDAVRGVMMYKVAGKIFAILCIKGVEAVILKCDPHLADMLRQQYSGVGHRSHLDRRYWISVQLDSDVPAKEVKHLIAHSYDQVCLTLTRKHKAELAALS